MSGGRYVSVKGATLWVRHVLAALAPLRESGCRLDVPTSHKSATGSSGLLLYGSGSGGSITRRRLQSRACVSRDKSSRLWLDGNSNLVDSASSHTLVSKIKPCMSKYKSLTLKLRTAHYISYSLFDSPLLLG